MWRELARYLWVPCRWTIVLLALRFAAERLGV
jgi:hypothetical protein